MHDHNFADYCRCGHTLKSNHGDPYYSGCNECNCSWFSSCVCNTCELRKAKIELENNYFSKKNSRFVLLFPQDEDILGYKVTHVWLSTTKNQCRVLKIALPILSLDDIAIFDKHLQIFDLKKRKLILTAGGDSELEQGWTISENTTAFTNPSNWSPPNSPMGKLFNL